MYIYSHKLRNGVFSLLVFLIAFGFFTYTPVQAGLAFCVDGMLSPDFTQPCGTVEVPQGSECLRYRDTGGPGGTEFLTPDMCLEWSDGTPVERVVGPPSDPVSQNTQLVSSGRDGDYNPDGYGSCEVVDTVNSVITFLIKMTGVLVVIVFLYSGFLMVSSRGDAAMISQAKGLFANVLIGFVILLAAFLIVNTILGILVGGAKGGFTWQKVECQYASEYADADPIDVKLILNKGIIVNDDTPTVGGDLPPIGPSDGASCESSGLVGGDRCYAPNRCNVRNEGSACSRISTYSSDIAAAASKYNVPASRVRGVIITESGGDPGARSSVGALGLMQIMPATARASCGLSASDLLVPSKNIDCGTKYYAQQYRSFGTHDLAAAAYNAGPGSNSPSNDCPGLTQWQCPFNSGGCCSADIVTATTCSINTGFAETRKYVDKVNAAAGWCN